MNSNEKDGTTPILGDIENQLGECPICWEENQEIIELPCNHQICKTCKRRIRPNKRKEKLCPFCRKIFSAPIVPNRIRLRDRNSDFRGFAREVYVFFSYLLIAGIFGLLFYFVKGG
jgi:hypothetical protein